MLKNSEAFGGFSVNDLETARRFYGEILGLEVLDNPMSLIELHFKNGTRIIIYPKVDHVPATFTVLNFPVVAIDQAVDELTKRGVSFEQYSGIIATDEKGIHSSPREGLKIAWFKDPAGNILSIIEEQSN
jgi:catechol 2,3-dioxygenase-like lactoylglutathione lyase family enzyme